jgi:hypothetical protein
MKKVMLDPSMFDEDKYEEEQVEECAEVLMKAEEIKKDAKLMEKIKQHLEDKKKKITSIAQLKEKANNFSLGKKEQEEED